MATILSREGASLPQFFKFSSCILAKKRLKLGLIVSNNLR